MPRRRFIGRVGTTEWPQLTLTLMGPYNQLSTLNMAAQAIPTATATRPVGQIASPLTITAALTATVFAEVDLDGPGPLVSCIRSASGGSH